MNAKLAQQIMDASPIDCRLNDDYSGRGMYGRTTTAIYFDRFDVGALMQIAFEMGKSVPDDESGDEPFDFESLRIDNLGKGIVLY